MCVGYLVLSLVVVDVHDGVLVHTLDAGVARLPCGVPALARGAPPVPLHEDVARTRLPRLSHRLQLVQGT